MSTFGGFGTAAPTFGTASNTQTQAGTLFGATSNNSQAGTLFGANTINSSAAGTLFGGGATTTSNTGFGGFNKLATTNTFGTTTAQPAATGFGGFGAPATSAASGGFGTTPATGSPFSFGAPTVSVGFGFGQSTATSAPTFGQPAAPSTGGGFGGFGAATAKPTFGGGLGTNTLFGNNQPQTTGFSTGFSSATQQQTGFGAPRQQQPMGAAPVQEKVWQELALIRAHFDPTSPLCQFRHYFYNMVPVNEAHLYARPQNQDEQLWNEAIRKNPDPTCLVPVLAIGFDDILKRMEIQSQQVELHQEKLKETSERLTTVQRQYALGTLVKLEEHKRRHTYLAQRLLRLLRYSQVLRYKGFPLLPDEIKSMNQLQQIKESPASPEKIHVKLHSLYNQLGAIQQQRNTDARAAKTELWRYVREEDIDVIAGVLREEHTGIEYIANILKEDTKQLEDIEDGLKKNSRMN